MGVPPIPKKISKAETVFQSELRLIRNEEIRKFVIKCFDKLAADYFWTCPCSTTGKYHPQISLGTGGLIRHTKLAVWWGIELLRALPFELQHIPTVQDEVVAALLLHDIRKNGDALNAQGYAVERNATGTHGAITADKIEKDDTLQLQDSEIRSRILAAIAGHMGVWTDNQFADMQPYKQSDETIRAFSMLVHLADYCASRKVDDQFKILGG